MTFALSPKAKAKLERFLADKPEADKALILQMLIDLEISPDEEFFAIIIGLGYLQGLPLQAPRQLHTWSEQLQQQLDSWQASYGQTLTLLADKATATAALSETATQLSSNLTTITQVCNALMRQLQNSYHAWGESWEQQEQVNGATHATLLEIQQQLVTLTQAIQSLSASSKPADLPDPLLALGMGRSTVWQRCTVWVALGYTVLSSATLITLAVVYIRDRPLLHRTAERVEYLLQKQNRRDCVEGVLAPENPLCSAM